MYRVEFSLKRKKIWGYEEKKIVTNPMATKNGAFLFAKLAALNYQTLGFGEVKAVVLEIPKEETQARVL